MSDPRKLFEDALVDAAEGVGAFTAQEVTRLASEGLAALNREAALEAHYGKMPDRARILKAHTQLPPKWLGDPRSGHPEHMKYAQAAGEGCFICAAVLAAEAAEARCAALETTLRFSGLELLAVVEAAQAFSVVAARPKLSPAHEAGLTLDDALAALDWKLNGDTG